MNRVLVPPALARDSVREHPPGACVRTLGGPTMGTNWSVRYVDDGTGAGGDLPHAVRSELDAVVAQMSTWDDASCLSRFNAAPAGSWHELPAAFFTVLDCALAVARDSGGAYDPTVGPLVNLWGFGPSGAQPVPGDAAVQAQRGRVGWHRLEIDRARRAVRQPGGAYLDLSGVAKGYAVDAVGRRLRQAGVPGFLVEIGGELAGHGVKPGLEPWWVELEQPPGGATPTLAALHGLAVATTGSYRRYFVDGRHTYSHTLDPRTGRPVDHGLVSVTVLHPECMVADAMATALTVLGPAEGPRWAARRGLAALFVQRGADGYRESMTPTFLAMTK